MLTCEVWKKKEKKKKNLQEENTSKSLIIKLLVENLSEITKSNGLKIICQIEITDKSSANAE